MKKTNDYNKVPSQILKLIKSSKNILLHLHPKPDPDSIGSALAFYWFLKQIGKKATIIQGGTELPENFSILPGYEKIVHQNFFETKLKNFDLFIILDSGSSEMISRLDKVVFPSHLKTVVIDHHRSNKGYGQINLIDDKSSATAEMLYKLFKKFKIKIDKKIATNLYIGIYGDTGGFRYSNATPETMRIVAELVNVFPNLSKLIEDLNQNHPREKIVFESIALKQIETFFDDRLAISVVSYDDLVKNNLKEEHTAASIISNVMLGVKPWQICLAMIEKKPNFVAISIRSKNNIDISEMATLLGGGGHKMAAGCVLEMNISDAKQKILDVVSENIFKK